MAKQLLTLVVISSVILSITASPSAFSLFGRRTTTTTTTTTTTVEPPTTERSVQFWLENNIPKIANGCTGHYVCKKKIKKGGSGRVCVKYCLKSVECPDVIAGIPATISTDWCITLNPDLIAEHDKPAGAGALVPVMQVNMIDFPCQPGYLPDSRGRCREVW